MIDASHQFRDIKLKLVGDGILIKLNSPMKYIDNWFKVYLYSYIKDFIISKKYSIQYLREFLSLFISRVLLLFIKY